MSRSKWKGPYVNLMSLKDLVNNTDKYKKSVKEIQRNTVIIPFFIGITFNIYNGKSFNQITVNEDMVGHKFGEFSPTRKKFTFKKKIKIRKKKKK